MLYKKNVQKLCKTCLILVVGILFLVSEVKNVSALMVAGTTYSTSTTDDNAVAHLDSNATESIFYYDRSDEDWSHPQARNYTGWGYDGKKYVNGIAVENGTNGEGMTSYEGNVLGTKDVAGEGWAYFNSGGIAESSLMSVSNGVLNINDASASSNGGLTIVDSVLSGSSDFILTTKVKVNSSGGGGTRPAAFGVGLGGVSVEFSLDDTTIYMSDLDNSGNAVVSGGVTQSFTMDTTDAFHVYTLVRSSTEVTLYVDGTPRLQALYSDFGTAGFSGVFFGALSGGAIIDFDVDYFRYDLNQTTFSNTPEAGWHAEASSSSRGTTADFPLQSYIIATDAGITILNAKTGEMWMRFDQGAGDALLGPGQTFRDISMADGKLYVPRTPGGGAVGAFIVDFQQNEMTNISTVGVSVANTGIEGRNSGSVSYSGSSDPLTTSNNIYWMDAATISTTDYIAIGTSAGVSIYQYGSLPNSFGDLSLLVEYKDVSSGEGFNSWVGKLTDGGELYAGNVDTTASLNAFYNITSDSGAIEWTTNREFAYTESSTPKILATSFTAMDITEDTSSIDGTSNTLYYLNALEGVSVIQEKQGDEANGSVIHYGYTGSSNGDISQKILPGSTDDFYKVLSFTPEKVFLMSYSATTSQNALAMLNTTTNTVTNSMETTSPFVPASLEYVDIASGPGAKNYVIAHDAGFQELYLTLQEDATLSDAHKGIENIQYTLVFTPMTPISDGGTIELVLNDNFANSLASIGNADVSVSGTGITSSTETVNTTTSTIVSTLTTSSDVDSAITITIGDGAGGLNDLQNPNQDGVYTISFITRDDTGMVLDEGVFLVNIGSGSTAVFIGTLVTEAMTMTISTSSLNFELDPSVNEGKDITQYTELQVSSNATSGYKIYGRLDDGNGNARLRGNGDHVNSGTGENTFGFEARNAAYDGGEVVDADATFVSTSTILNSNGSDVGLSAPTNAQTHTIYYDIDIDYTTAAGNYSGTLYYTVIGTF